MCRLFGLLSLMLILLTSMALAGITHKPMDRKQTRNLPLVVGSDKRAGSLPDKPSRPPVSGGSLDSAGTAFIAGYTSWDVQHSGTVGKMIGVDDLGYVHLVWTHSDINPNLNRSVYYNCWDPATQQFLSLSGSTQGIMVNSSQSAGYTTLAVSPDGWAFPAYHERFQGTFHSAAAMDFTRRFGAFIPTEPAHCGFDTPLEIMWPKIAIGPSGTLHMISTEQPAETRPQPWMRISYSRGTPTYAGGQGVGIAWEDGECGGFTLIDTVVAVTPVIAASKLSERVAIVWPRSRHHPSDPYVSPYNNDLCYMISEDGGLNWGPRTNVTGFIPPMDTIPHVWDEHTQTWIPDTARADQDTNRVFVDCDALFDCMDDLHVAFTTVIFRSWEQTVSRFNADIWHWSERNPDEISHVAGMRFRQEPDSTGQLVEVTCWPIHSPDYNIGNNERMTQRPSLSLDWYTGYLYCAYQWYDPMQCTTEGHPMADILVSVSRNCGRSWSDSTNITSSGIPLVAADCNPAAAGAALSERDMSVADRITYQNGIGYLHMEYMIDTGCGPDSTGPSTLNTIVYRRIPVNSISPLPIHNPGMIPLHVDSSMYPGRLRPFDPESYVDPCNLNVVQNESPLRPCSFRLYQNYPNPFNPVTHIQFDLLHETRVSLRIFNVLGQEVATLLDGKPLSAGAQTVTFDASMLPSGVYVYRFEAGEQSQTRKMVLLK